MVNVYIKFCLILKLMDRLAIAKNSELYFRFMSQEFLKNSLVLEWETGGYKSPHLLPEGGNQTSQITSAIYISSIQIVL